MTSTCDVIHMTYFKLISLFIIFICTVHFHSGKFIKLTRAACDIKNNSFVLVLYTQIVKYTYLIYVNMYAYIA